MLEHLAGLHQRSVRPPVPPLHLPWEEIGPGYCYGPAFGHIDITHQILDTLPVQPEHTRDQLRNLLSTQQPAGNLPALLLLRQGQLHCHPDSTHPPLWVFAAGDYFALTGDREFLGEALGALVRQIGWFEANRSCRDGGFYCLDIVTRSWESGIDHGVRFDTLPPEPLACVDTTSQVLAMYGKAADWSETLGEDPAPWLDGLAELRRLITCELFDDETGFFHDSWTVGRPDRRRMAFEGMWPLVVGAATAEQAARVIDENLLNPRRFLTCHPMATVALNDEKFELRMWRGPAWNSMTLWAVRGCLAAGRPDAARAIAEAAMDATADVFAITGTVWEFYCPFGGDPRLLGRKPWTRFNAPCPAYLGHNPLLALARIWEQTA